MKSKMNLSAATQMPDCLEMPYTPEIVGAKIVSLNSSLGAPCGDFGNLGRFADAKVQSHAPNSQKTPQLPPQILELDSNKGDSSESNESSLRENERSEFSWQSTDSHDSPEIPDILQDSAPFLDKCDIVGPICESSDYLAKDITLPRTNRGDLLAILDSGAYGFSMSSNYNSRLKCVEVALYKGRDFIIRKRESFDESIANEAQCADLQTKGGEK